jgi:hypothetical protein
MLSCAHLLFAVSDGDPNLLKGFSTFSLPRLWTATRSSAIFSGMVFYYGSKVIFMILPRCLCSTVLSFEAKMALDGINTAQ